MIRVTGNVPAGMNEEGTTKGEHSRVVPLVDLAMWPVREDDTFPAKSPRCGTW